MSQSALRALYRHVFRPAVYVDWKEPALLADHFAGETGCFVDIGANDPVRGSVSYPFEQEDWTGILVEPLADMAEKLRAKRKVPVFEVACGRRDQHEKRVPFLVRGSWSTIREELVEPGAEPHHVSEIRVRTLDSMLQETGIDKIDLLSIDVEGAELDVLDGFDMTKIRPRLILLEDHARDFSKHDVMVSRGYKLVRRSGLNAWYVPKETDFPVSLFGRLQFFRKYTLARPLRLMKYDFSKKRAASAGKAA